MHFTIACQYAGLFRDLVDCIAHTSHEVEFHASTDGLAVQCMDVSHAVLIDVVLPAEWFTTFECPKDLVWGVSLKDISAVLGCRAKRQLLMVDAATKLDRVVVAFSDGEDSDIAKEFELPMYDFNADRLEVPDSEHDVDLTLDSSRFAKLLAELESFGPEVRVECRDDAVGFKSQAGTIAMAATLPQADMTEYALPEEGVDEVFASNFLVTAACFAKLAKYASVPKSMAVHFSAGRPAELQFVLGTGASAPTVRSIVAPRMNDAE